MTTKHLIILLAVVAGTSPSWSERYPGKLGYQPVGIVLKLPEQLGGWWGRDVEVSEREHTVLGFDTEFARKVYVNTGTGDMILASVVLSGQDMMTGIHRPERCLLAQGWNPGGSSASERLTFPASARSGLRVCETFARIASPPPPTLPNEW